MTKTAFRPAAMSLEPLAVERVWGGRSLEKFGRKLPPGSPIGESWEISGLPGRSSRIRRGPGSGGTLEELLERAPRDVLGRVRGPSGSVFPLLFKLLDARETLSVQVHPRDDEAVAIEGPGPASVGKTEAWVIVEAEPGAEIVQGVAPGTDWKKLHERLEKLGGARLPEEEERSLFRWVPVQAGDVILNPAGTVHAIGGGLVLAEIQQNSDLTYRLYDWGRKGADGRERELHLHKSRRVRPAEEAPCPFARLGDAPAGKNIHQVLECEAFRIELLTLEPGDVVPASTQEKGGWSAFQVLIGWSGEALYNTPKGDGQRLGPLDFLLLPASLGAYELRGSPGGGRALRVRGGRPES